MSAYGKKPIEDMTPVERLTCALLLALTADSDARSAEVVEIAEWLAEDLSAVEVAYCQAVAHAQWKAGGSA